MSNEYNDWLWDTRQENKRLIQKYPFLMIKDNGVCPWVGKETYEHTWLDDMPEGWRIAFGEQFCEELLNALGDYADKFVIVQLKEKWGELVVYYNGVPEDIYDAVENVIHKYSDISAHTCVSCGKPGTMRKGGWICPWCDDCYEKGTRHA